MPKPKPVYLDCGMVSTALKVLDSGALVTFLCRPYDGWIAVKEWNGAPVRMARIKGRGKWTADRLKAAIRQAMAKKKGGAK